MNLEFYARVRTCEKRVIGKQPLVTFLEDVLQILRNIPVDIASVHISALK